MFNIRRKTVGIDIGSKEIRIVELTRTPVTKLTNLVTVAARRDLAGPQDSANGDISSQNKIAEQLKEAIVSNQISTKNIITAIRGRSVNTTTIVLPRMSKVELDETVPREVKRKLPVPLENPILDYKILGEVMVEGIPKLEILVITIERKDVNEHLSFTEQAGFTPKIIGTTSLAFLNSFRKSGDWKKGDTIALIDIGDEVTNIAIIKDGDLHFARETNIGAYDVISAASENMNLKIDEAEETIQEQGIPTPLISTGPLIQAVGQDSAKKLRAAIQPALDRLLREMHRSFVYYKEQFRGETVKKIVLSGRGSNIKGMDQFLSEGLGTGVIYFDPLRNIQISLTSAELQNMTYNLTIPIGLALYRRHKKGINLLPKEIQEKVDIVTQRISLFVGTSILLVGLLSAYFGLNIILNSLSTTLDKQEATFKLLYPIVEKHSQIALQKQLLVEKESFIKQMSAEHPLWSDILIELSNIVPKEILLTNLSFDKSKKAGEVGEWHSTFSGIVLTDYEEAQRVLRELLSNLEESPFFRDISLQPTPTKEQTKFNIGCKLAK